MTLISKFSTKLKINCLLFNDQSIHELTLLVLLDIQIFTSNNQSKKVHNFGYYNVEI